MKASRRPLPSLVLSGLIAALVGFASDAGAATYMCTPSQIATFTNRVHVLCTAPATGGIHYFAVCSEENSAYASRVLSEFTAAKVTGRRLLVYYTAGDTSGAACGCQAADCRLITGVELVD